MSGPSNSVGHRDEVAMPFDQRADGLTGSLNRRMFLRLTALGGGAALLAACQSAPSSPAPTAKPAAPEAPAKPAAPEAPAKPAEPAAKAPAVPAVATSELDALVAPA